MPLLDGNDPQAVLQAAQHLAAGALVALPTETVYGLGARADDDAAVAAIFAAKGRPPEHPLIVHVVDAAAASHFAAEWPPAAQRLADRFWPGPVSLVLKRRPGVADAAAAGAPTIALRCPDHPVARSLLRAAAALGVPGIAAPSANRFGRVSPTRAAHVADEFGPALWVLDGGACREGIESAIVDCSEAAAGPPRLLRPGTLDCAALHAALGGPLADAVAASPRVSGSLASHYAPRARLRLFADEAALTAAAQAAAPAALARVGVYSPRHLPLAAHHRSMPDNPAAVAHQLYAVLRDLDALGVDEIWVQLPPSGPQWAGIHDRLKRAATPGGTADRH